ncbi:MAG TPA: hypothetical protein VN231_11565 [Allosphingosinicella sp.]|nr:hypothetical protein [Allosphingosinicella sp.]
MNRPADIPPADLPPLPAFLRFAPVPVRSRRDGWSPALQLRFIVALARGAGVDEAARSLGRSRQAAYALRRRAGAEEFARAWDSAVAFAREVRGAAWAERRSGAGIETLLVPRFYRGRMIGYVLRDDLSGAMARLARLDRIAERLDPDPLGARRLAGLRALSDRLGPLPGES